MTAALMSPELLADGPDVEEIPEVETGRMLTVSEATDTENCRWEGCPNDAEPRKTRGGSYNGLCREHISAEAKRRNEKGREAALATRAQKREEQAVAIVTTAKVAPVAARIVDAAKKLDKANVGIIQAIERRDAALRETKMAVRDLLVALQQQG